MLVNFSLRNDLNGKFYDMKNYFGINLAKEVQNL